MINYNNFTNIKNLRNNFQSNQPFKHLVFDDIYLNKFWTRLTTFDRLKYKTIRFFYLEKGA